MCSLRYTYEALLLSDKVIMMTNGPEAKIGDILEVNLEHPRNRVKLQHDPEYIRCREAILRFLKFFYMTIPAFQDYLLYKYHKYFLN